MQYLEIIRQEIGKILKDNFGIEGVNFTVGFPDTLEHGDVTTNVCLVAAKLVGKSPVEVFEIIRPLLTSPSKGEEEVQKGKVDLDFIEKIEFKNPGFINIWIKWEKVTEGIEKVAQGHFVSKKYYGKRVLVEHTSINLFKPFTIGHLMNNFTGEFIYRVAKELNANVENISYPSDISLGVAKAIYIIKKDGGLTHDIWEKSEAEIVKYLGESYVRGVAEFKVFEEKKSKDEIRKVKDIANNLFKNIPSEDLEIFEKSKKINLNYFKDFVEKLNSKFDNFIFESESAVEGLKIIKENTNVGIGKFLFWKKSVFQKSEGAIIYQPKKDRKDINTAVFVNGEGNPTYLGKDIGLLSLKFGKYNPDLNFIITDNEQTPHFKTFIAAAGEIDKNWEEKTIHVPHGRMTFKGKKMSSRLGGVPSGEEVINAVLDEVKEKGKESVDRFVNFNVEEKEKLQREIALSALRVTILRSKPGVNIDFDPERATSFEGDSGPYLCYTFARCCSLLEKGALVLPLTKGELEGVLSEFRPHPTSPSKGEGYSATSASSIERKVFQFEKIVVDSAEEIAPQKLIKYLFELAGEFNSFYAKNKIIDEDDLERTKYNVYLTQLVQQVLNKGLYLIGVDAPTKM